MKKMKKDSPPRPHKSSTASARNNNGGGAKQQQLRSSAIGTTSSNQIEVNTSKTVLQKSSPPKAKMPPSNERAPLHNNLELQDHKWPNKDGCG